MKKFYLLTVLIFTMILTILVSVPTVKAESKGNSYYIHSVSKLFGNSIVSLYISEDDPESVNRETHFNKGREILESLYYLSDNVNKRSGDYLNNVFHINNNPNKLIEIDKRLYDIIKLSEEIKELTDGYFDISIGKIIDGWKDIIDNIPSKTGIKYTPEEIDDKIVNIKKIPVIENGIELSQSDDVYYIKIKDGVKIDLGAITKGYAVQRVYDYFNSVGLKNYYINGASSSLSYAKKNNEEDNFRIGISNPYYLDDYIPGLPAKPKHIYGVVNVSNVAVTTSGDTLQNAKHRDILLHHIISPKTKQPENHYRTLSIIHPDAGYSDAITTALFSMDPTTLNKFVGKIDGMPGYKLGGYITFGFNENVVNQLGTYFETYEDQKGDDILKTTFRDFMIISAVVIIAAVGFYMFRNAYKKIKKDFAIIYYKDVEIVRINYKDKEIEITEIQSDTLYDEVNYPIIDKDNNTITVLAAPQEKIKGYDDFIISTMEDGRVRYEFVIKYNLEKHTVEVIREICENKHAMSHGEVSGFGISCITSQVSIKFMDGSGNDEFDGEI